MHFIVTSSSKRINLYPTKERTQTLVLEEGLHLCCLWKEWSGLGRKILLEEILRVGNVSVPSSFVGNQWLESKIGWWSWCWSVCLIRINFIRMILTNQLDPYERKNWNTKMQPLTEMWSLPWRWKSKMELQVLNADDEPPNARQTNLQGKQTAPEEEEAQRMKKKQKLLRVEERTKVSKKIRERFRKFFYKKIISISHCLEGNWNTTFLVV